MAEFEFFVDSSGAVTGAVDGRPLSAMEVDELEAGLTVARALQARRIREALDQTVCVGGRTYAARRGPEDGAVVAAWLAGMEQDDSPFLVERRGDGPRPYRILGGRWQGQDRMPVRGACGTVERALRRAAWLFLTHP